MEKGISVVMLAYREAENLKIILPKIKLVMEKINDDYEILVVDTMEPMDDTADVCKEFGARYVNQEEPMFGGAFRTAIKYARKDKFLIMDADGSHNPCHIYDMYQKFCDGYDIVIGSRYVKGGKTNDRISSRIMSRCLNFAFRLGLGIKAKDMSTDFRIYRTELLKDVTLTCDVYDILEEVLLKIKLIKKDMKIGEVPIDFQKRMFGESKRKLFVFIMHYIKTLFDLTVFRFAKTQSRYEFARNLILYGIIGGMGFLVDFGVFSLINILLKGTSPELSNIFGAVCGFALTFCCNTFFNFKKSDDIFKIFLSYGMICLLGAVISTSVIAILKKYINIYLLKIVIMLIVSFIQFICNKFITYKN